MRNHSPPIAPISRTEDDMVENTRPPGTQTLEEYMKKNNQFPYESSPPKSTGDRDNKGKPQLSYIFDFPNALRELVRVSEYGAEHRPLSAELQKQLGREKGYGKRNWKKGLKLTKTADSQLRHMLAFFGDRVTYDGEAAAAGHEIHVLAQVAWNAMAELEMYLTRPDMDDRDE